MKKKRVAILFFGLSRSLGKTIESIKKNLFTPLDNNSIDYDIFIHTNKISGAYHNRWSKEHTDNYNNENIIKILNPKYFIWDNQETIINNINFNEYYKKLGSWSHGFSPEMTKYLIKNMCLALYSKKQITMLFEKHKENYDYAIIIRPDLQLHNKININYFKNNTIRKTLESYLDGYNSFYERSNDVKKEIGFVDFWFASISSFKFSEIIPNTHLTKSLWLFQSIISFILLFYISTNIPQLIINKKDKD